MKNAVPTLVGNMENARLSKEASSLRILLASMAPFVGGAEVAAERLALGLMAEGHDVLHLLGRVGPVQERMEKAGLRCIVSPMYFTDKWHYPRYWLARRRLRAILRAERPDIIHSNDLTTHQIMSDAARDLGVPRICHHRFPFPGAAIDWLNKFGGEHHLFVSQALMDEMCTESARLKAASRNVVLDGLPLPVLPDEASRQRRRKSFDLPTDKVVVIITGQVIERKGVADLISAWALLNPKMSECAHLVVIGDDLAGQGSYRRQMEKLAKEKCVPARFVGFQKEVADWIGVADLAVVPSHVEPLGNATLEAMSLAIPVIGTHVGGIPESVIHEETGLLVEPRNPPSLSAALARLIGDASLRRKLGAAGRTRCERIFSLEAHARAVLAEYERILFDRRVTGSYE